MSSPRPRKHGTRVSGCQAARPLRQDRVTVALLASRLHAKAVTCEPTALVSTTSVASSLALVVDELRLITAKRRFETLVISVAPEELNVTATCPVISRLLPRSKAHGQLIGVAAGNR